MPSIDVLDPEVRRKLLKWAVVEHYRTWLIVDQPLTECITKNGNTLSEEIVRRISKEYDVNRGIRKANDADGEDPSAKWLAKRLSDEARAWPKDLIGRANKCKQLAGEAYDGGYTSGRVVSAVTKLMWFLQPSGWTMFDNLAATALGITANTKEKENGEKVARMRRFYECLDRRNFLSHANHIGRMLKDHGFSQLYGERVIDKFLVFSGAPVVQTWGYISECKGYLAKMSEKDRERLLEAAHRIAEQFANDLLSAQGARVF